MKKYTPPESIQPLLESHPAVFRFRRALRRADQVVLDHILEIACGSAPASYTLVEHILLAMLLAEQKQLGQLKDLICHSSLPSTPPEG